MNAPHSAKTATYGARLTKRSRPMTVYLLLALLTFQGLSGIVGGIGFVGDPTGENLRIPLEWLEGSPFSTYLIPGIVLLLVLGVLPLVVAAGLWARARGSRQAAWAIGVALIVWLAVEIAVVGYQPEPPFQAIYGFVGLAIIALAFTGSARSYSDEDSK